VLFLYEKKNESNFLLHSINLEELKSIASLDDENDLEN
jgi:hypothetical protein